MKILYLFIVTMLYKATKSKKNYLDFCKAYQITNSKSHLTAEPLEELKEIRSNMDSKRVY